MSKNWIRLNPEMKNSWKYKCVKCDYVTGCPQGHHARNHIKRHVKR